MMSLTVRSRSLQQQQRPEVAQRTSTISMLDSIRRRDLRPVIREAVAVVDITTCTPGMRTLRPLAALP